MDVNTGFLNPRRKLHKTPLFWISLGVPILIGAVLAGVIISANWDDLCFSFELSCVNQFFPTYKVPLGFASLGLITATLIGQMHRSGQSVSTMEMTDGNNRFSNRFKHEEEFLKFLGDISIDVPSLSSGMYPFSLKFKSNHELYMAFFPNNRWEMQSLEVDQADLVRLIKEYFLELEEGLREIRIEEHNDQQHTFRVFREFKRALKLEVETYSLSLSSGGKLEPAPVNMIAFDELMALHKAALAAYGMAIGFMGKGDVYDMCDQFLNESIVPNFIELSLASTDARRLSDQGIVID